MLKYLFLAALVLFLAGCSVEKNTATTRFYHNLTARYNIYFNGNESFIAGVSKVTASHRDDYAEILDVFEYSDPSTATAGSSDFERAIQKASKLISLKSITSKPEIDTKREIPEKDRKLLDMKEYNDWVDDAYLLIGKSRFYKHEFNEAESLFKYCITEANDPLIKEEASVWLARVCNEKKNYTESFRILSDLQVTGDSKKALRSMYYSTLADLYIKRKRYNEAIEPLINAVNLVQGKKPKYRLTYLLAQIFEQTGDAANASLNYKKVINMNPPYEVEFNTRINMAGVFDINNGNPDEITRELGRMLKDPKNREFEDQIYFALGNLSMKEGMEPEAIAFYRKSASARSSNPNQKGRSYLALSNHYYNKPDYLRAGIFLDSAVIFIDQRSPDYDNLRARSVNLNSLVSQLLIIQREDSLRKIAGLSEAERNSLISAIITGVNSGENQKQASDYNDRSNIGQYYENERRFQGNIQQEGKWYFYNQSALTFGRTEFRRRWGDRKLEDNWRRSNRNRSNAAQFTTVTLETNNAADSSRKVADNKKPEYYLKDLPLTDSMMMASNDRLSAAMLNAGKAFSERIIDTVRATVMLESLIARFPSGPFTPEALFTLYRINLHSNNRKAETFRQRLIEKYPDNEFSLILSDPGYYEKKISEMKVADKLYSEAYDAYIKEDFPTSVSIIQTALDRHPKSSLTSKFMLLHSYCTARTSGERAFREELKTISEKWPGTEESKKAGELIAYMNQKMPGLKIEEDRQVASELYIADTLAAKKFSLVIASPSFNLNQATFDVISYNIDNYTNRNYRTEGSLVDNFILITVSGFTNFSQALEYFHKFDTRKIIRNPSGTTMMTFVITDENLKKLMEDKKPERYDLFFREHYIK